MSTNIDTITIGIPPYTQTYELQKNQLLLHLDPKTITNERRLKKFLFRNKLKILDDTSPFEETFDEKFTREKFDEKLILLWVEISDDINNSIDLNKYANNLIKENGNIQLITPVYYIENQSESSASSPQIDTMMIRFKQNTNNMIQELVKKYNVEYDKIISEYLKPYHSFKIKNLQSKGFISYFDIKNQILTEEFVESVDFDWVKIYSGFQSGISSDTYFQQQWNLPKINLQDIGIIRRGNPNVYVAVIDSGFDLTIGGSEYGGSDSDEEMVFSPNSPSYYTHFNAQEADLNRSPPYHANQADYPHGTAVAGIIGASVNNNRGIAGIADQCKIMPIKIGSKIYARRVAAGLNWARIHGAKVVNMSFKCDPVDVVITAIEDAWNSGMVLCAASGNIEKDNLNSSTPPPIEFPARHYRVIAVGASDTQDQRKRNRTTPEESECWASSFGSELDVIAPGVLIWTTDEHGKFGFNKNGGGRKVYANWCIDYPTCGDSAGKYFSRFSGTSASAPHVAGLAALLFSQNMSLNNQQVRDIIESTCDKVNSGLYSYTMHPNRPNGTWNEEVGYGRINCTAALSQA